MYPAPRTQVPVKPLAMAFREPTSEGIITKPTKKAVAVPKEKKSTVKWQNPITVNDAYAAHWGQVVRGLDSFERPLVVKLATQHAKMVQKLSNATLPQLIHYLEHDFDIGVLLRGFMSLGTASAATAIEKLPTGKCRLTVTLASGYALHVVMCKFRFIPGQWILFAEIVLTNSDQEEVLSILRIKCGAPKDMQVKLHYSLIDIEAAFGKLKVVATANLLGMWLYRIQTLPQAEYWKPLGQMLQ